MIRIKRIYAEPTEQDGVRILVDRVWPRGMSKERARIAEWRKDFAPSTSLCRWFGHDPKKWRGFRDRYRKELSHAGPRGALEGLSTFARGRLVTLVYSAADEEHNQAVVLQELDELGGRSRST